MPDYLWSGRNPAGIEQVERVNAATADEAKGTLTARGWTELKLYTNEIHDFVRTQLDEACDPAYRLPVTPKQEIEFLTKGAPGFLRNWWKSLRESIRTTLILSAALAFSIYRQKPWLIIVSGGLLFLIVFLFPVLHFWFGRTAELFEKLHEARNWRKWDEVLRYLEALQRVQGSRKIGIGQAEMARYRALAWAGTGKLDEAIKYFSAAADTAKMPQWLFECHLASVNVVAARYEAALDCYRQALEHATEKGIVCVDYAAMLVQRFNRPAEARALLAQAEASELPQLVRGHLPAVQAVISYREGNFAEANRLALAGLQSFESDAKRRRFVFEPSILLSNGYLGVINAALGNKTAARNYFSKAEKYLATIRMDELISEYKRLMPDA
jgi:tetratricopeptide (TPR) repeat protein